VGHVDFLLAALAQESLDLVPPLAKEVGWGGEGEGRYSRGGSFGILRVEVSAEAWSTAARKVMASWFSGTRARTALEA